MTEIPTAQLLATFRKTLEELRRRKICRTENIPTGDFAEHLACRAFSLTPAANSTKGYDATDAEGNRIQIKGRRITEHNSSTQLSALRELETDSFDFLIVILFDPAYRVPGVTAQRAIESPTSRRSPRDRDLPARRRSRRRVRCVANHPTGMTRLDEPHKMNLSKSASFPLENETRSMRERGCLSARRRWSKPRLAGPRIATKQ